MTTQTPSRELLILWTTDDMHTVQNMILMYAENARLNGWWDEVTLLIWGASAKLVAREPFFREAIPYMKEHGVKVMACRQCAINLDCEQQLMALGVDVQYTGVFLTEWLQSERKVLSV